MLSIKPIFFALILVYSILAGKPADGQPLPLAFHVFETPTYESYFGQLRDFAQAHKANGSMLSNEERDFLEMMLEGPLAMATTDQIRFHENFIDRLRLFLQDNSSLAEDLCHWIYSAPTTFPAMKAFLFDNFTKEAFSALNIIDRLERLYGEIEHDKRFGGTSKEEGIDDSLRSGDVPSRLFSIDIGDKRADIIRTPNTTFKSGEKLDIFPEFRSYLEALLKKGKKHLYFNYMQRHADNPTPFLEEMDLNPELAIDFISIARNSPFYKQDPPYDLLSEAAAFKQTFFEELFLPPSDSHYYWTKSLDIESWKISAKAILEQVHQDYFFNQRSFSIDERRAFIDIAHMKMARQLIELLQPDIVNLTCHVSIDRGPTAMALLYIDLLLEQQGTLFPEEFDTIATLVYGPGALIRNRSIDPNHHRRFIQAAKRLVQKDAYE
jgi:hypothetical protein